MQILSCSNEQIYPISDFFYLNSSITSSSVKSLKLKFLSLSNEVFCGILFSKKYLPAMLVLLKCLAYHRPLSRTFLKRYEWSWPFVWLHEYSWVFHEYFLFVFGRSEHVIPNYANVRRRSECRRFLFVRRACNDPPGFSATKRLHLGIIIGDNDTRSVLLTSRLFRCFVLVAAIAENPASHI